MPAVADKGQCPLPVVLGEIAIRPGLTHFGEQLIGPKAAAQRHADQVLHQYIERTMRCAAGFDTAFGDGHLGGGGFHHFETVRRHQRDPRGPTGRMSGAARALHQPRHTFRRADLQHPLDRQEVDPEIEARSADHGLQRALLEAQFDPVAYLPRQRAVVQGDESGPVGTRFENRLVPDFRLRPGVGEDQRGGGRVDLLDHLRQHAQPEMTGPGEALDTWRQQRVDAQVLVDLALHQLAVAGV